MTALGRRLTVAVTVGWATAATIGLGVPSCLFDLGEVVTSAPTGSAGSGGAAGGGATGGDGAAGEGGVAGEGGATGGSGATGPQCEGLVENCGPDADESCCAAMPVSGGTFARSNDPTYPATVSDFRLDRFEVTVGRFRAFVAAGQGTQQSPPVEGSGQTPSLPASGWHTAWDGDLPTNTAALVAALKCSPPAQTWTDSAGGNERRPINCITWYEAFAFCTWDGGRLPTEAEWNYAAADGSAQRHYPWSRPPSDTAIDDTYAVYCGGSCSGTQLVGSKSPKGDGWLGHADLAGNVWEWALDWYASPYANPCVDCADLTTGGDRVCRGGSFNCDGSLLPTAYRLYILPSTRDPNVGIRCARSL